MHKATIEEAAALKRYLHESVAKGACGCDRISPRADVTVVMYFFWNADDADEKWQDFAGALLATWRSCGLLHTVVVSNMAHGCLKEFAGTFPNVEIQIEPSLKPGDINSMSIDCNSKLHARFETKYVMIVQDDGFPLREGLDEFVEMGYDFIGSPYCRALALPNLLTMLLNYCPSNGGFSLRTKKMCRLVADYWVKEYSGREFIVNEMSEDLFYTKTLPIRSPLFWLRRKQAPSKIAERFSYEGCFPLYSETMPFGFHTATGFFRIENLYAL